MKIKYESKNEIESKTKYYEPFLADLVFKHKGIAYLSLPNNTGNAVGDTDTTLGGGGDDLLLGVVQHQAAGQVILEKNVL